MNGAVCNTNTDACQCSFGYAGTFCGTFLGCNAGGQFACLNGGVCITSTGACQCANGYTGAYCSSIFTTPTSSKSSTIVCKDTDACQIFSSYGYCALYQTVQMYCQKSCKRC